jgi:hypothetical protein
MPPAASRRLCHGETGSMTQPPSPKSTEITMHDAHEVVSTTVAAPADRLLGRAQAAQLLGVSKSTLRRMEGEQLMPVVGPKNVRLFHEEQIRSLVVTRRAEVASTHPSGDLAADAFELFDAGLHPVDVVKKLRVEPSLIESLHQRWSAWRGMLVLSTAGASQLHELLSDDGSAPPAKTETELLALARTWIVETSIRHCEQCRSESASFCRRCAKVWGLGAAKREVASRHARRL